MYLRFFYGNYLRLICRLVFEVNWAKKMKIDKAYIIKHDKELLWNYASTLKESKSC